MEQEIFGVIAVVFGSYLAIFSKREARGAIDFQNRKLGFNFGDRDVRYSRFLYLVGGILFVIWGLMVVSGTIELK